MRTSCNVRNQLPPSLDPRLQPSLAPFVFSDYSQIMKIDDQHIEQVRRFSRLVTRRVGALNDDYLGRGRPPAESRLLFEIGRKGGDVRELRARLTLDSGYFSRLLRSLEAQELVKAKPALDDARVRRVSLTAKGRRELAALDRQSEQFAASLLSALGTSQRERLIAAMAEVERLMKASSVDIEPVDPTSDAARACVALYLRELDARFVGGFDESRSPSPDPGELLPPNGAFLLARLDGEAIGCGSLKRLAPGIGEVKRMWVAPTARGLGVAQRLLVALEKQAHALGLRTVRLDTNSSLTEACALYARNGYREIQRYNNNPYAHHWFEKHIA